MTADDTDKRLRIEGAVRLIGTPFIRVDEYRLRYRRDSGEWTEPLTRINIDRGNGVAALLFDPARGVLHFVRQFRFSTYDPAREPDPDNGWLIELVAGTVEKDEPPREAIIREAREETGFEIAAPEPIGCFYSSPGALSERVFLFYAEVSEARRAHPAKGAAGYGVEDEEIETVGMTVAEFLTRIEKMEICDAKTIAAGEWLRRKFPAGAR
jgi:nudix-type nucleoside diphosphatase (YffH/AdpP family)